MQNSQGQIERRNTLASDSNTLLSSGSLASGGNVSGTITFEQPMGDEDLKLIFEPSIFSDDRLIINLT